MKEAQQLVSAARALRVKRVDSTRLLGMFRSSSGEIADCLSWMVVIVARVSWRVRAIGRDRVC
jgi:hypothetical protein